MTPDQVIKEAIEKIARTRYDAFLLGALGTFKEAGATDEEAMGLVKHGNALVKKLLANAAKGQVPKGEGLMSRSLGRMMQGDTTSFAVPQVTRDASDAVLKKPGLMDAVRSATPSQNVPGLNKYLPGAQNSLQRQLKTDPELMKLLNTGFGESTYAGHITPERRLAALAARLKARK